MKPIKQIARELYEKALEEGYEGTETEYIVELYMKYIEKQREVITHEY